jgi:spectinomycin phosphotransferase
MRTPPQDLTEAEVGVAVVAHWDVVAETIEYAPVGFGSHHWVLTGATGRRWFVTADAVADSAERLAELTAALTTAHALRHRCGLEFVVPPQVGVDDELLSITGRYAVALYPHLERVTDALADPQQMLTMITALHATTPDVGDLAAVDDLTVRDRSTLEAVLANPDTPHSTGPYAADFAGLVRDYQEPIRVAFDRHDVVATTLGAERGLGSSPTGNQRPTTP